MPIEFNYNKEVVKKVWLKNALNVGISLWITIFIEKYGDVYGRIVIMKKKIREI